MMKAVSMETIAQSQKPINWIWKKYIPEGAVTVLAARGGVGKSGFALYLAGLLAEQNQNTLYVDYEQTTSHMSLRWKEWGFAKYKDNIFVPSEISDLGMYESTKPNMGQIKRLAKEVSARLIVVDSMSSLYASYDIGVRKESVKLIESYRDIANKLKCGLLVLAHVNKDPIETKEPGQVRLDSITGSAAIVDMARSVLGMSFSNDQEHRIIEHLKHNFTPKQPEIKFKFTEAGISDLIFGKTITKPTHISKNTGTKIGQHVEIIKQGLLDGIQEKKKLRKLIIDAGGTQVDATKAYDKAVKDGLIIT